MDRKKAREWNMENSETWIGLLQRLNDEGFRNDPKGIINLDESPFMMGFEREIVYAKRGTKHVKSLTEGSTREQVTVLFCGTAQGTMFVPLILYDGVVMLESMVRGTHGKVCVAVNASGIMDADVLTGYFRSEVIPKLEAEKVK